LKFIDFSFLKCLKKSPDGVDADRILLALNSAIELSFVLVFGS